LVVWFQERRKESIKQRRWTWKGWKVDLWLCQAISYFTYLEKSLARFLGRKLHHFWRRLIK